MYISVIKRTLSCDILKLIKLLGYLKLDKLHLYSISLNRFALSSSNRKLNRFLNICFDRIFPKNEYINKNPAYIYAFFLLSFEDYFEDNYSDTALI